MVRMAASTLSAIGAVPASTTTTPAPSAQRIHSVTSGERLNGPVCRVVMTLAPFD